MCPFFGVVAASEAAAGVVAAASAPVLVVDPFDDADLPDSDSEKAPVVLLAPPLLLLEVAPVPRTLLLLPPLGIGDVALLLNAPLLGGVSVPPRPPLASAAPPLSLLLLLLLLLLLDDPFAPVFTFSLSAVLIGRVKLPRGIVLLLLLLLLLLLPALGSPDTVPRELLFLLEVSSRRGESTALGANAADYLPRTTASYFLPGCDTRRRWNIKESSRV